MDPHRPSARSALAHWRDDRAWRCYTLALAPDLLAHVLPLDGFAMIVNYGLDRLRFPAPLPTGERMR